MGKRVLLMLLSVCLALLSSCASQPAAETPRIGAEFSASSALIDAASRLIEQEEYSAAEAVLDQLEGYDLNADTVQALGLLRGALKARPAADTQPVVSVTAPPLATLTPSLSPEADPDLLSSRQQEVNIFLTVFAETGLSSLPGESLVDFALCFLQRHQPDAVQEAEDGSTVDAAAVEETVARYFGMEARHSSGADYTYREGRYTFLPEKSLPEAYLAIASSAVSLGGGQYAVTFDRYAGEPGEDLSPFHGFTSQEISVSRLSYRDSGEAILQAVIWEGRETFQLLKWQLEPKDAQ